MYTKCQMFTQVGFNYISDRGVRLVTEVRIYSVILQQSNHNHCRFALMSRSIINQLSIVQQSSHNTAAFTLKSRSIIN